MQYLRSKLQNRGKPGPLQARAEKILVRLLRLVLLLTAVYVVILLGRGDFASAFIILVVSLSSMLFVNWAILMLCHMIDIRRSQQLFYADTHARHAAEVEWLEAAHAILDQGVTPEEERALIAMIFNSETQ